MHGLTFDLLSADTLILSYLLCGVKTAYATLFWMRSHNQDTLHIETKIQKIPTHDVSVQANDCQFYKQNLIWNCSLLYYLTNKETATKLPALFEKCVFQCEERRLDSVDESQLEMTYRWLWKKKTK